MSSHQGRLVSGGRLQVPAEFRRAMDIGDGDPVTMTMVDGEMRVRPYRDTLARVQSRLRKYLPDDVSLSDELIADRRAQSDRE